MAALGSNVAQTRPPTTSPSPGCVFDQLRAYVARCGGDDAMLDGWSAHSAVREPAMPEEKPITDKFYHDPHGKTFNSMASVVRSLGLEALRGSSDPAVLGNLREYEAGCGSDEDTLDGWTAQVRQPAAAHPAVRIDHVFIDSQRQSSRPMTAVATTLAERQGPHCSQRPIKRRRTSDDYISETESRCGAPSTHRGPWLGCAAVPSDTQCSTLPAYEPEAAPEANLLLDADNVRVLDDAGDVWDGSDVVVVCAEVIG